MGPPKAMFSMPLGAFLFIACIVWKAVSWRIRHTYLEDDLFWFFPVIDHLLGEKHSALTLFKLFHLPELTLFDALHVTFLKFLFGYNFFLYPIPSYLIHLANGVIIYRILSRAVNCSRFTSSLAGFIYLAFYGHYHAYVWPMAMHHTLGVFFVLLFIYEYLKMSNAEENIAARDQGWTPRLGLGLYGLAFLASFMRLSILLVPLIIGIHAALTDSFKKNVKMKYWIPVFLLISWYQILILILGYRADVLNAFLRMENLVILTVLAFMGWLVARRNLQRIYYFWLIIPFAFMLCLHLWFFPQNTLTPANVALRWQVMPLPAGAGSFLVVLSWGIMYAFTRHVICREKKLGVFIIWYMLVFPYLLFRLGEMPSRYLIYLSPVFAVILAVFLGEIIADRFQGFARPVFRFTVACLFIGYGIANVRAIHERSIRSFLTDYHWKYDDILIAQYIKRDLMTGKVSSDKNFCIQGVERLSYLENWGRTFLKDRGMDGYESLRIMLESVSGIPKEGTRINEACVQGEITYDFTNDAVFSSFRWPEHFKKEDAWEIYGNSFGGDHESLRIDNMLQRQVNFFDQGETYWLRRQGRQVAEHGGFDIYDFKNWYFAIPQGELFNLARFKIGDYQESYFAGTKHELRRLIGSQHPHAHRPVRVDSEAQRKWTSFYPRGEHIFRMRFLGIHLGYLHIKNEGGFLRDGRRLRRISLILRPWKWLQKISKGRIGYKITSLLTAEDLLPVEVEQIDLMGLNKGEHGRKTIYHHNDLFMERRGYREDINFDTRDPVTAILWIFAHNKTDQKIYRTTLNIGRDLFGITVVSGSAENNTTLLRIKGESLREKRKRYDLLLTLDYTGEERVPKNMILKWGPANFSAAAISDNGSGKIALRQERINAK